MLLLASPALAQEDADARTAPAMAEPGEDVDLIFRIDSPDLAEVVVEEEIRCTVTFPNGNEREPCGATAGLAEIRTAGSGAREYVFDYQAPADPGTYEVAFEAESTVRVPSQGYSASTSFEVSEALAPQAGGDPAVEDPPGDGDGSTPSEGVDDDGSSASTTLAGTDGSRFMVSTTMATGVLAVALVANRSSLGGP